MRPPSLHSNFFSSLKQVEKRLKLEHPQKHQQVSNFSPQKAPPPRPPPNENFTLTESLSSPICVYTCTNNNNSNSILQESSELPLEFLSCSSPPQSTPTHQNPPPKHPPKHPKTTQNLETNGVDDIEQLMQLLGLSDFCEQRNQKSVFGGKCGDKCECEGGFYEKIVGVKGPKCEREVQRMEGWIKYYMRSGGKSEKMEPLRLAFLLMGKASFVSGGSDCGFGGIEFPSTIEEFLKIEPPKD